MAKSKLSFNFKAMYELAEKIEAAGGDLQKAADSALKSTHGLITPKLGAAIAPHKLTGATGGSLQSSVKVEWESPLKAHVNIGFRLDGDGAGIPSIFLMWGTPKMKADTALHDAAYSAKVRREVAKTQQKALETVLKRLAR